MTLDSIKLTASDAGKVVLTQASTALSAAGRFFVYTGNAICNIAKKVAEWIKINFPVYFQYIVDYSKLGFKYLKTEISEGITYIKNNKNSVGTGVVIGMAISAVFYSTYCLFFKSTDL